MIRRPRAGGRGGWSSVAVAGSILWLLGPGAGPPARAEPAFAARTGYSCGQCHVNRTGGGMRTAFGSVYTQTILPTRLLRAGGRGYLLPANPDARLGIGGDARFAYLGVYSDETEDTSSFEIPPSNVYAQLRIIPRRLVLYLDQGVGSGATSTRELFGLLSFRKGNGYMKVGKFIPPYGWALPDDDAFIRESLGFAFSAPDNGIEVGFEPRKWSMQLAVINGNAATRDDDRTKKFTLRTARRFKRTTVGVSGANDLSGGTTTTWAGLFAGTNIGRLSLFWEEDWRRSRPNDGSSIEQWAALVEADLLIKRGMNLKYAHDWIEPNRDVETDQRQRDSLGFEYIPYPFVQLRAFVRWKDGPPQVAGARDEQVDLEIHIFF